MPTTHIEKILSLGVGYGHLELSKSLRESFVQEINKQYKKSNRDKTSVWTGDLNYFPSLHKLELFKPLFKNLKPCMLEYCKQIGTNPDFFDFHVVRSWGTKALNDQNIPTHTHSYASLAVVYYPKVSQNCGGLILGSLINQNELIPDLINKESYDNNILSSSNDLSAKGTELNSEDDLYIIFPAKTSHATNKNESNKPRYSIAIDILMTLKETKNIEYCLPPIKDWKTL